MKQPLGVDRACDTTSVPPLLPPPKTYVMNAKDFQRPAVCICNFEAPSAAKCVAPSVLIECGA